MLEALTPSFRCSECIFQPRAPGATELQCKSYICPHRLPEIGGCWDDPSPTGCWFQTTVDPRLRSRNEPSVWWPLLSCYHNSSFHGKHDQKNLVQAHLLQTKQNDHAQFLQGPATVRNGATAPIKKKLLKELQRSGVSGCTKELHSPPETLTKSWPFKQKWQGSVWSTGPIFSGCRIGKPGEN